MGKLKFETGKEDDGHQAKPGGVADDQSTVAKIDEVMEQAVDAQASTLHVEPGPDATRVRMRVGGVLQEIASLNSAMHHKVMNRFKILAAMDITKGAVPQRGFFKIAEPQRVDCNAYIYPTVHGEMVTVDLQYKKGLDLSLEQLGFFTEILKTYKDALSKPPGVVLVVGPPGSGCATTAYASLASLNSPQKFIATFEPIVKYDLAGVMQSRPPRRRDFTFLEGVQAMMQSGPDVAYVGEVDDPEVAQPVLQAGGTRLVIARMVSHDAATALVQLLDMGIQPFLLTSSISVVLAQRLLRRICDGCKEAYTPPEQLVNDIGYKMRPDIQFYRGQGCAQCGGTGFRGSIALFELLVPNDAVREAILSRSSAAELRDVAAANGMVPLKRDGVNKVVMGYTAIEEVLAGL